MSTSQNNVSLKLTATQTFNDLDGEFFNEEISCRLIHFWEARNHTRGNILMGLELLLIDEKSTTIQAFIPTNRIGRFENLLKPNSVYKMKRFIVSPSKKVFKVSDHKKGICFTNQTSMDEVTNGDKEIDFQKFQTRLYNDFAAIVDTNIDLFDVVGQIRLITGNNLQDVTSNVEAPNIANAKVKDRVFLHLLMKDGETIQVYLWDAIATKFRERWNESETKPSVLLLTTVNPKLVVQFMLDSSIIVYLSLWDDVAAKFRSYLNSGDDVNSVMLVTTINPKMFGGKLYLNSTPATRFYFDQNIEAIKEFTKRMRIEATKQFEAADTSEGITKNQTLGIAQLFKFILNSNKQTKKADFLCKARVIGVQRENGWSYVSCAVCSRKLDKYGTTLRCTKCIPTNVNGVVRYRVELTVHDGEARVTVLVSDSEMTKLTNRTAASLILEQANGGNDGEIPTCIQEMVGKQYLFQIKVTPFNFTSQQRTFTVSKITHDNQNPNA